MSSHGIESASDRARRTPQKQKRQPVKAAAVIAHNLHLRLSKARQRQHRAQLCAMQVYFRQTADLRAQDRA